ncbi:MAG TPA: MqnA/MqnD/SBP family protein [Urbifossiella sp.]|nr:MqnA/MqnD/SBP family protein [Urbifossiella sp.]
MSERQLIRVGHSPDPDDAFMFHALANDKIPTGNLRFVHELQDIETLNRRALKGELEVTAVSIHAYSFLHDKYALLPSGCSMGDRYGPMIVARKPLTIGDLANVKIAVPGTLTTAFLTLKLLFDSLRTKIRPGHSMDVLRVPIDDLQNQIDAERRSNEVFEESPPNYGIVPFDEIIPAVASGEYDAGLIIHEGQLTFQNQGLHLVVDLGVWWQDRTGLPLPLGGNVVRKDLGKPIMSEISRLIKQSIRYGLDHRREALDYALKYARDMDVSLADKFVGMYVNDWTLHYGDRGRAAIRKLLDAGHDAGVIPHRVDVEFVE